MNLPFSQAQFFEVFAAYNLALWPAQVALNALAMAMLAVVLWAPRRAGRLVSWGLALLWTWQALAYHLAFFWSINPAAPFFAAVSLVAALAFAWQGGIRGALQFQPGLSARSVAGLILIVLALLAYPAIGVYIGHRYPASPTFGLPCPTTLFTFGLLLMAAPNLPKVVVLAPLAWALIGSTAALALGVSEDLGLVVVAALGLYMLLRRSAPTGDSPHIPQP